jgi:hypothetical protein
MLDQVLGMSWMVHTPKLRKASHLVQRKFWGMGRARLPDGFYRLRDKHTTKTLALEFGMNCHSAQQDGWDGIVRSKFAFLAI